MMKLLVLLIALIFTFPLRAFDSSHRMAIYSDLCTDIQALGALWELDLSAQKDLPCLSLQGEYSLFGSYQSTWEGSHSAKMDMAAYRAWISLNRPQTQLRIGLQRLNFGSAKTLRPLQWFDSLDPLDPHQYTGGVEAILLRHHWLNNANLWLWGVLGDSKLRGNEFLPGEKDRPEFGGRMQYPLPIGDMALSYHQRDLQGGNERRLGLDLRMDYSIGIWAESSLSQYEDVFLAPGLTINSTLGMDYTFSLGNGLAMVFEQGYLRSWDDENAAIKLDKAVSAMMLSYPLNILDNVAAVLAVDWEEEDAGVSAVWQRVYDYFSVELSGKASSKEHTSLHAMINLHF